MGIKKLNSRKKAENGDFQVVGSLLYAHYPIYFFLSFEQYYQVLCCVKSLNQQIWVWHISKCLFFSDFSSMGVGLEKESSSTSSCKFFYAFGSK